MSLRSAVPDFGEAVAHQLDSDLCGERRALLGEPDLCVCWSGTSVPVPYDFGVLVRRTRIAFFDERRRDP